MIQVKLQFIRIIFENKNNNFKVVLFKVLSSDISISQKNIVVSGEMQTIDNDWLYECSIKKSTNPKYLDSYLLVSMIRKPYVDISKIISFFSSSKFKGIGKKTVEKLVNKFGNNLINDFISNPNLIDQADISDLQKDSIKNYFLKTGVEDELFQLFLLSGVSQKKLLFYLNFFSPAELKNIINSNPYSLMYTVYESTFLDCDKLAIQLDFPNNSEERTLGIIYDCIRKHLMQTGNTYLNLSMLFSLISLKLTLSISHFNNCINQLVTQKVIHKYNDNKVTIIHYYLAEEYIALRMKQLLLVKTNSYEVSINKDDAKFDTKQMHAIEYSLNKPFTIITGSPGTGKTTIVKKLINLLSKNNMKNYALLAPTGKAAKHLSTKTKAKAQTIHKFLDYNENYTFNINENNPSKVKILIIDEFSMVDTLLFYNLLLGTPFLEKIVLIGDKNQLPSINPGYLLNDFMNQLPNNIVNLEIIYRQSEGSNIIQDAISINDGILPNFNSSDSMFYDLSANDFSKFMDIFLKNIYEWDIKSIQILSPMYRGTFGIDNLNLEIQKKLMEKSDKFIIGNKEYYIGDKIIQIINSSEYNVYNGEIGYIELIDKNKKTINVKFEDNDKLVSYVEQDFIEMTKLAYAISVHKSQGSEFDIVIYMIFNEHKFLLDKKILYTGMTRASKKLILLGSMNAIQYAINNDKHSMRLTMLQNFLN